MGREDGAGTSLLTWGDYVCPFCYLGDAALGQVEADLPLPVERRAFELRPPGTRLPDLASGYYRPTFEEAVVPWAERLGVEVRWNPEPARTRKAHEAATFARAQGRFDAMHRALYRAYWVEGRDIGRIDVLAEIGAEAGLDALELRVALDVDGHAEAVRAEAAEAASLGIRAVPVYRIGAEQLTGLREPETLKTWVAAVAGNGRD